MESDFKWILMSEKISSMLMVIAGKRAGFIEGNMKKKKENGKILRKSRIFLKWENFTLAKI